MFGAASIGARFGSVAGLLLALVAAVFGGQSVAAQSMVGAVVCEASSSITITTPESDSIVTQPTLTIQGQVAQASQIEIKVDGAFDSIIPLIVGQTSYTGSVHLSLGTHTVTATAISLCPGANGTTSVVVTHERAAATPSSGGTVDTSVDNNENQTVNSNGDTVEGSGGLGFVDSLLLPLQPLALWLNIGDFQESDVSLMPLGRAILFAVGLYLAIIGLAPVFLRRLAKNQLVISLFSSVSASKKIDHRVKALSRLVRIIGALLVISSLAFL